MQEVVQLGIPQFSLIYLLLLIVLGIMKKCRINQTKLLLWASIRMTIQLILAGLVLTYIFQNALPVFTVLYLLAMMMFAVYRTLSKSRGLNLRFKIAIALSIALSGLFVLLYFVTGVVRMNFFNPQYAIPIGGMVFGNTMTGVTLGIKVFTESLENQRPKIEALLNLGVAPAKILQPFVNSALETALLPTLNAMLGMGIVSLPGMMTGQILAGTLPLTAIMYQIAIMVAICAATCLSVFCSLYFGYKTMYNKRNQITW